MLLSPKQTEFVKQAHHRWNMKGGATRSGKTYLDFRWIIPIRIRERIGKDGLTVILGVTKSTIERNVLEPMRNLYGDLVGEISDDNTVLLFGEHYYALGAEKASQVSKIRGASIKYAYGDEVADWSEEVFELLKSRLDKDYSCFDGTFNPQYPGHWLKEFLESDADIFSQTYTIDDNPFLSPSFVEALKQEYEGTVYYDRYILGRWVRADGLIYQHFADNTNDYLIDDVREWCREHEQRIRYVTIGVDFGGTGSATKFQATAITDKWTVIAFDEEYIKGMVDPDALNGRFSLFVRRVGSEYGKSSTWADSAEQILIRGFQNTVKKDNLPTGVSNAKKMEIHDRIKLTLLLMAQKRLYICRKCEHLIEALCEAVYDSKRFDDTRLDDGTTDIDSLDAFEYSIEPYYEKLLIGPQPSKPLYMPIAR